MSRAIWVIPSPITGRGTNSDNPISPQIIGTPLAELSSMLCNFGSTT